MCQSTGGSPDGSGMSREAHVPFYEGLGVQFPRPTHRFCLSFRSIREQPRGGVASTDPAARASDAALHVAGASAAVRLGARHRPDSLPGGPTSAAGGASPCAANTGLRRMGGGDVCLPIRRSGVRHPATAMRSARQLDTVSLAATVDRDEQLIKVPRVALLTESLPEPSCVSAPERTPDSSAST